VRSTTAALAAFVFTDSVPFSGERRDKTGTGLLASVALLRGTIERVAIGHDSKGSFKRFKGEEWEMFNSTDEVWPP
jgi:hypothetical protein